MNLADSLNIYCTMGDLDRLSVVAKLHKNPLSERGSSLVITSLFTNFDGDALFFAEFTQWLGW